jgi:membrane protein required for beta-lactamase induction
MDFLLALLFWFLVSIPVALFLGWFISTGTHD